MLGPTTEAREDDRMHRSFDGSHFGYLLPIKNNAPWVVPVCRNTDVAPCKGRAGVLALHFIDRRGQSCGDQHTQQGGKKPGRVHIEVARDGRLGTRGGPQRMRHRGRCDQERRAAGKSCEGEPRARSVDVPPVGFWWKEGTQKMPYLCGFLYVGSLKSTEAATGTRSEEPPIRATIGKPGEGASDEDIVAPH